MGDKNADAHDAEDRSDCFEHESDPSAQRRDLTARGDAQSKRFRWGLNFCRGNDDFLQHLVSNLRQFGEQVVMGYVAAVLDGRFDSHWSLNPDQHFSLRM